jgi:hypothetical protein
MTDSTTGKAGSDDVAAVQKLGQARRRMTGAHPKVFQTVMRHSTITLTMDTYGHLFPGQEAEAVSRLRGLMTGDLPEQDAWNYFLCPDSPRIRPAAADRMR